LLPSIINFVPDNTKTAIGGIPFDNTKTAIGGIPTGAFGGGSPSPAFSPGLYFYFDLQVVHR